MPLARRAGHASRGIKNEPGPRLDWARPADQNGVDPRDGSELDRRIHRGKLGPEPGDDESD